LSLITRALVQDSAYTAVAPTHGGNVDHALNIGSSQLKLYLRTDPYHAGDARPRSRVETRMPRRLEGTAQTEFGARMAGLRQAAGYSQRELAAELGISQRMVAYYEGEGRDRLPPGRRPPRPRPRPRRHHRPAPRRQARPLTHQEAPGHPALAEVQAGREAPRPGTQAAPPAHRRLPREGEAPGERGGVRNPKRLHGTTTSPRRCRLALVGQLRLSPLDVVIELGELDVSLVFGLRRQHRYLHVLDVRCR